MKVKNFTKKIEMERKIPEFKNKMTKSQFAYICNLQKKQIGKVIMSYAEMRKYMTKSNATKLIELLSYEYYDINVVLLGKPIKPKTLIKEVEFNVAIQTQKTMTRLDMLETELSMLNNNH